MQLDALQGRGDPIRTQMAFQAARVRKPLLAVSSVAERGNITVFDSQGSYILSGSEAEMAAIRKAVAKIRRKVPLTVKNGVYTMQDRRVDSKPEAAGVFRRQDRQ